MSVKEVPQWSYLHRKPHEVEPPTSSMSMYSFTKLGTNLYTWHMAWVNSPFNSTKTTRCYEVGIHSHALRQLQYLYGLCHGYLTSTCLFQPLLILFLMYVLYRQELNRSHFSVCNVERWPGSWGLKISDTQCHGIIASVYNRYKVGLLIIILLHD